MNASDLRLDRRSMTLPAHLLAAMAFLLLSGAVSAAWEVIERPGELRVANGRIAVTLTQRQGVADINVSAADTGGAWQPVCRTLHPDFTKTPEANKLFDTAVTPHRYQAGEILTQFSIASRSDKQVKSKMSGQAKDRVVAEQILTLDHDGTSLHVDVSATLNEPLLDYFLSTWEFLPPGAPDFVHSPTAKKDDPRSGPAVHQVIGDHAFHSPAIVLQKGGKYVCMVPDLAMINAYALQSPDARRKQAVGRNHFSVPIIAGYLKKEIIPQQRWIDLEVYYSCGANALSYVIDELQGLPIRGNLSTMWAAKGFKALYQVTRDKAHLEAGAKVADYMSFSQASWDPHYVYTANPFGGCTADNVDTATWMDARQCDLVESFIWYGLELGRQDLVERGIAAARASTVPINHPRHIENGIYPHVNLYGFGLGPENINHESHNQSAMRTHPSWGECSGIFTGLADAARFTGGGIIDLDHGFAVGTDGIHLSFEQRGDGVHVTASGRLSKLKLLWEHSYDIALMIHGKNDTSLYLNGIRASIVEREGMRLIRCKVAPNGNVSLQSN